MPKKALLVILVICTFSTAGCMEDLSALNAQTAVQSAELPDTGNIEYSIIGRSPNYPRAPEFVEENEYATFFYLADLVQKSNDVETVIGTLKWLVTIQGLTVDEPLNRSYLSLGVSLGDYGPNPVPFYPTVDASWCAKLKYEVNGYVYDVHTPETDDEDEVQLIKFKRFNGEKIILEFAHWDVNVDVELIEK